MNIKDSHIIYIWPNTISTNRKQSFIKEYYFLPINKEANK